MMLATGPWPRPSISRSSNRVAGVTALFGSYLGILAMRGQLQLGVLSAVRMREARAGVGILRGSLHVRFRAFLGPPARGVSFRIADLHTTAVPVRLRTMAIASAGGNAAQHSRGVGQKRNGTGQQNHSDGEEPPDGSERKFEPGTRRVLHGDILWAADEKTDSSGSSKKLLPGSWNWVEK